MRDDFVDVAAGVLVVFARTFPAAKSQFSEARGLVLLIARAASIEAV
jgi:hypothetical protein